MPRPCGCFYWANQYGAGYTMCVRHGDLMQQIASARGITLQEAFNEAVAEFVERVKPV